MTDEIILKNQVEFFCRTEAKKLYNLALFTVGSKDLAKQLAVDTFAEAFSTLDRSDAGSFRMNSAKLLYRSIKKNFETADSGLYELSVQGNLVKKTGLRSMLLSLNYDERFLLLLFLYQKFTIAQISQIMDLPESSVKKCLNVTMTKTA